MDFHDFLMSFDSRLASFIFSLLIPVITIILIIIKVVINKKNKKIDTSELDNWIETLNNLKSDYIKKIKHDNKKVNKNKSDQHNEELKDTLKQLYNKAKENEKKDNP